MVKVENGIATREPIPNFLDQKDTPEARASLLDLSWTDPQFGVQDAAWWPEEDTSGELGMNKKWGAEVLTLDTERKVVLVKRKQVAMTAAEIEEIIAPLRNYKLQENNTGYEAAIGRMTADYPPAEIQTWERQRAEVVAWAADKTVETPWITMAAQIRGINRDEYLARTLSKVTAFAQASAFLTGRRQYLGDLIAAAATAEQLNAITIDYTLPGA